jgi:hypothetical protein
LTPVIMQLRSLDACYEPRSFYRGQLVSLLLTK